MTMAANVNQKTINELFLVMETERHKSFSFNFKNMHVWLLGFSGGQSILHLGLNDLIKTRLQHHTDMT